MRRLVFALSVLAVIAIVIIKPRTPAPELSSRVARSEKKASRSFSDISCADTYLKLYARPILDVRMVFGYKDARPARFVDDRYEEMIFIQRLTADCQGERHDCGFQQTRSGPSVGDVFTKKIAGPDGDERTIQISIVHSSVGADDDDNRKNPFQKWRSDYARRLFLESLKTADIVFYNGHSRSGGGPDFAPPLFDHHGHVRYAYYKAGAASLLAMQGAISSSHKTSNLQMVGLFSCASEQLFTQKLIKAKPGLGVLSSRQLLYFSDALENSLVALSSLLEMKCRSDWSGLFETSTDLNGFWLNEAAKIKDRGQMYSRPSQ